MLIETKPHHVHIYEAYNGGDFVCGLTRVYCYQLDCYAENGPSLSKEIYPPDVIGPKLMIAREE